MAFLKIINPIDYLKYSSKEVLMDLNSTSKALLCFDPGNFRELRNAIQGRAIKGLSADAWLYENKIVICGNMGIGSPAAVNLLEELIACGIRQFISFGTAGALRQELNPGSLILCDEAFSDEGTSRHYFPDSTSGKPSKDFLISVKDFLQQENIKYNVGKSWTTDAPYMETHEKLNHYTNLGADVVEMEASALYNAAAFRNVELLALFVMGDSIADGIWKPYFDSDEIKIRLVEISNCILDFLCLNENNGR